MTENRHHAIKSHHLPPNTFEQNLKLAQFNGRGHNSLGGGSHQPLAGLVSLKPAQQPSTAQFQSQSLCLTAVSPTSNAAYCSDNELPGYSNEGKCFPCLDALAQIISRLLHRGCMSIGLEFETVNRIVELCLQRSARLQRCNSASQPSQMHEIDIHQQSQESSTPTTRAEGTIVDKLTLIKSYEQTLRN